MMETLKSNIGEDVSKSSLSFVGGESRLDQDKVADQVKEEEEEEEMMEELKMTSIRLQKE